VVFDVSMKGAKVMSETGIRLGERVAVSLRLPNQATPMTVEEATVRWERDQTYGLEFINLSAIAEMRLRKFISIASMPVR
jgi:c-di-GMP-binding flagellar brake protein YcgR